MARFPQLDRLSEYGEWLDRNRPDRHKNPRLYRNNRDPRTLPLDELIKPDAEDC